MGDDFGSEHEKYLTEKEVKGPAFVYDFPSDIKSFYMRRNEDGRTCASFDCLVP